LGCGQPTEATITNTIDIFNSINFIYAIAGTLPRGKDFRENGNRSSRRHISARCSHGISHVLIDAAMTQGTPLSITTDISTFNLNHLMISQPIEIVLPTILSIRLSVCSAKQLAAAKHDVEASAY
jgi:hypothetical protein